MTMEEHISEKMHVQAANHNSTPFFSEGDQVVHIVRTHSIRFHGRTADTD